MWVDKNVVMHCDRGVEFHVIRTFGDTYGHDDMIPYKLNSGCLHSTNLVSNERFQASKKTQVAT